MQTQPHLNVMFVELTVMVMYIIHNVHISYLQHDSIMLCMVS